MFVLMTMMAGCRMHLATNDGMSYLPPDFFVGKLINYDNI
jgi:hypothetical protein